MTCKTINHPRRTASTAWKFVSPYRNGEIKCIRESHEHLIHIPVDSVTLEGALAVPAGALGVVVFAHGSGSSRHSPRNLFVAQAFRFDAPENPHLAQRLNGRVGVV